MLNTNSTRLVPLKSLLPSLETDRLPLVSLELQDPLCKSVVVDRVDLSVVTDQW